MTLTTHRVVGLLEWPAGSAMSPEALDIVRREVRPGVEPARRKVLSLRLPIPETQHAEVLSADLGQLRIDLECLFTEFSDKPLA